MSGEIEYGAFVGGGGGKLYPDVTKGDASTPPSGDPDGWILADPNPDAPPAREAVALRALADHLEPRLGGYLRQLLADDSDAHRYGEMRGRVERADGVVRELRRMVDTRARVLDEWIARARAAEARVAEARESARAAGGRA